MKLEGIIEEAYSLIKSSFSDFYLIVLVFILLQLVWSILVKSIGFPGILSEIFSLELQIIWIIISIKMVDGKKVNVEDIFNFFIEIKNDFSEALNMFFRFFVAYILYYFMVIAGLLLLVIPGIIWGYKYRFVPTLTIDKKMGPIDAFKKSAEITQGFKFDMFIIDMFCLLINIIGLLAIFIGLFFTIPLTLLVGSVIYRRLMPAELNQQLNLEYESDLID